MESLTPKSRDGSGRLSLIRMIKTLALMCGLACALGVRAIADQAANSLPHSDRERLQAVHESRLNLARERKPPVFAHGVYLDFRAAFVPMTEDFSPNAQQQLLAAARKTGTQVLILTRKGPERLTLHGLHDDILVITGAESDEGSLLFQDTGSDGKPVPGSGVEFVRHVDQHFHPTNEGIAGIQISITRADLNISAENFPRPPDQSKLTRRKLVDNLRAFPDEFFAGPSVYPKEILAEWDQKSEEKPLTGIGVNSISIFKLAAVDPFEQAGIDPFEVSFRNLVTHILAEDLTVSSIRNALTNGHIFVAHDWLSDPAGFSFGAINNLGVFGMGDTTPMLGTTRVVGITPVPAKLRLIHKGTVIQEITGTNLTFQAKEPGPYRLEAWLTVAAKIGHGSIPIRFT
jgi:hypothetical protein